MTQTNPSSGFSFPTQILLGMKTLATEDKVYLIKSLVLSVAALSS